MNTEEGLLAYAKIKSIQPIIKGLLGSANSESEYLKSFKQVKSFFEILDKRLSKIETLIVNLDSKIENQKPIRKPLK